MTTTPTSHPARAHLTLVEPDVGAVQLQPAPPAGRLADPHTHPASRRRRGWFEANPGCFGRAVMFVAGAGVASAGAAGWFAWRAWKSGSVRRAWLVIRFTKGTVRRYDRMRSRLGR